MNQPITRITIVKAVQAAVEPLEYVVAMWSGGAAAFGRVDEWSDVDLHLVVEDAHVEETAAMVDAALATLGPLALRFVMPQPAWHGHHQTFYRHRDASPFLLVDCVVMRASSPNKFLEREIHGTPVVYFDKREVVDVPPLDRAKLLAELQARLPVLRGVVDSFRVFPIKELERGNNIEALSFYQNMIVRWLVEALRLRYCPIHYNFGTRYVYYDLPAEVVRRLEPLYFVGSPAELRLRHQEAVDWFVDVLDTLTPDGLAEALAAGTPSQKTQGV